MNTKSEMKASPACTPCKIAHTTLYFVEECLQCYWCLPPEWLTPKRSWKLLKRSVKTTGKTKEQLRAFCEKVRKREELKVAYTKPKAKRSIFKKLARHIKAVAVFADEETLRPSDVWERLAGTSMRSVKSYLNSAVHSGDLIQIGRGLYQRSAKVQKTQP